MYTKTGVQILRFSSLFLFCFLNTIPGIAKSPRNYLAAKEAIESGNLEKLKAVLKKGKININFTDKYSDSTLLIVAVENQQLEIVRFLLENKANPNLKGLTRTPLVTAILKNNYDIFDLLLIFKADVNLQTRDGFSPLHAAVYNNDERFIVRLLALGANPNVMSRSGRTPLMSWPYGNAAQKLIEAGADVNLADRDGNTALMNASGGISETVRVLLAAKADVNASNSRGDTALIAAVACGRSDIVRQLLSAGADLAHRNKCGITAEEAADETVNRAYSNPHDECDISHWCIVGRSDVEHDYESTRRIINEFKKSKYQESPDE
jgi:ankyrin repeat protein